MLNEEPGWEKTLVSLGTQALYVNLEKPVGAYVFSGPQKLMSKNKQTNKKSCYLEKC